MGNVLLVKNKLSVFKSVFTINMLSKETYPISILQKIRNHYITRIQRKHNFYHPKLLKTKILGTQETTPLGKVKEGLL